MSNLDKAVLQAKKSLSNADIKDVLKKCSCGGRPVTMELRGETFGETNT